MLTRRYKSEQIVNVTLPAMVGVGIIFLIGSAGNWLGVYGTIIAVFAFLCCVGITYPNTAALSLAPFGKNAGTAAALMGCLQMAMGTLTSIVVSMFKSRSTIPMAGIMATAAVVAFLVLIIGRRNIRQRVEAPEEVGAGVH